MKGSEPCGEAKPHTAMLKTRQQQIKLKCVAGISIAFMVTQMIIPLISIRSSSVEATTQTLEVVDTSESTISEPPLQSPAVKLEPMLKIVEPAEESSNLEIRTDAEPESEIEAEPEPAEEVTSEIPDYSQEDAMCISNMLFGEISIIIRDDHYSVEEQDHVLQEWACVPLNHVASGIADTIPEVIKKRLPSGYYVWHPKYATQEYADNAMQQDPERYERCMNAAIVVLTGQMEDSLPENVIYASLKTHGKLYKSYSIRTQYYSSTVYLSYA